MSYLIELSKERFKFSASHFTIFNQTSAESLHGHNYRLLVAIELTDLKKDTGMAFPFHDVKQVIEATCEKLDEKILLPKLSPYLKIESINKQTEVRFADRFYSFPTQDCMELPLVNISSEELARYCAEDLLKNLDIGFLALKATIEETNGQRVSYQTLHK